MRKKLKDVCMFYSGTGFPIQYQGQTKGEYPFYKVGDIANNAIAGKIYLELCNNYISSDVAKMIKGCILPKDTVVFAKIGEALKLNRRAITSCDCLIDNNAMGIAPKLDSLRIQYFYFCMKNLKMQTLAESTTVPSVRKTVLEKYEIEVPSLVEQEEIEKKLTLTQKIIEKRRQELSYLDEIIKARFVEMFGDPVANDKGWKMKPLLDMGKCKNGMNFHYDDSGVEISCLGVGDFKDLSVIDNTKKLSIVSLNEMPSEEYLLKDGDIVFVRSNGNKDLVGRSLAIYPGKLPTTFSGFCIRYRIHDDEITVPYLLRVLKMESMRKKMAGRGANIQNLNQQILGTLVIPVPPIELQNQFVDFVRAIDKSKFDTMTFAPIYDIINLYLHTHFYQGRR
ncbi:restriction endonuclease subunit S [Agathobacter rectalis]|jgi:type I restriction enzyme S subunit|uniref:Restriction endonuclease subunit S n=1 Tax=Agathobacter rectalis TaxID=39491 RepID=A0A5S4VKF4_9FIRM|nr:restriction endonuclease subunit S [Agathobacter rectalis]TYL58196.1 restriction endonuclease subunit S [Agathobacter rectalis]